MHYLVRSPWWLKMLFPRRIWTMPGNEKIIYLSFDDGPEPSVTPYVLDELAKYDAKATFFCIGKNCIQYPEVYDRILADGHATGNHSFDHLNGWENNDAVYLDNVLKAKRSINSALFRPPYGRLKHKQQQLLLKEGFKIIMWSVLSGDFDEGISPEKCCENVINKTRSGNIIVFHDSLKAYEKMIYALPLVLKHFTLKGYRFGKIVL